MDRDSTICTPVRYGFDPPRRRAARELARWKRLVALTAALAAAATVTLPRSAAACVADADCDDANPCTLDGCDAGSCRNDVVEDGTPCPDDTVCNGLETCAGAVCVPGVALECADGNACTDETCDAIRGCLSTPNTGLCDDGNACTTGDLCRYGSCVGGDVSSGCSPCAAIAVIPPQGGTFVGATSGAGTLAGRCGASGPAPERVYAWTPATSGIATVTTCGTATTYDTVLYLRANACATGTDLACNDDTAGCPVASAPNRGSRLTPTVTAGLTYYVVVDGYSGAHGTYTLTVEPPATCGNGVREAREECDGDDRTACASGECSDCRCTPPADGLPDLVADVSGAWLQYNASVPASDLAEGCASAPSGVDLLRFTAGASNRGTAPFVLGDPACPTPCSANPGAVCGNPEFVCGPTGGNDRPHYTNFARFELLGARGETVRDGRKPGWCFRDSVTCPNAVFTSCSNQGLSIGCGDVYRSNIGCQYLDVTGVPDGAYLLQVRIDPFDRIVELDETNNVARMPVTISRPSASACAQPTFIPAQGGAFTGTTRGTGTLSGNCGRSELSPEQVFVWTPALSGMATISTCGSGTAYDTVLHVRRGECLAGAEVACNDDTPGCMTGGAGARGSAVTIPVEGGESYFVVVDGYNGQGGPFSLTVMPPDGAPRPSACNQPLIVPPDGGTVAGTTSGVSTLAGSCGRSASSPEAVALWTPSRSGTATLSTCGAATAYDTVLYVRRAGCTTGPELACNDDTSGCATAEPSAHHGSRVTVDVVAGETYAVVVDGYNGGAGAFSLQVVLP